MTTKKENILKAALRLFAEDGYAATSTSKVAREAGVSEGLIFRHFENKEGLLNALMEEGAMQAMELYGRILDQEDPKSIIRDAIKIPFMVDESHYYFWRLLYALKWQTSVYDDTLSAPLKAALISAFSALGYKDPETEAEVVMILLDGIATSVLLRRTENQNALLKSILKKYKL